MNTNMISKQFFAEILLSRLISMETDRFEFLVDAILEARVDLNAKKTSYRKEETEEFTCWAQTIKEVIFPEVIGPIVDSDGNPLDFGE